MATLYKYYKTAVKSLGLGLGGQVSQKQIQVLLTECVMKI